MPAENEYTILLRMTNVKRLKVLDEMEEVRRDKDLAEEYEKEEAGGG